MNTLLEDFFDRKKNSYLEPKRLKVPRGEKIGISKVKYEAALVCSLCNFNLKGLAEHLGGSYEVVRRWKSEEQFNDLCKSIQKEFCWNIDVELENLQALTPKKTISTLGYNIYRDINIYNQVLIDHIESRLKTLLSAGNGYLYFDLAKTIVELSGSSQLQHMLIQASRAIQANAVNKALKALENPKIADRERMEVITLLRNIKPQTLSTNAMNKHGDTYEYPKTISCTSS